MIALQILGFLTLCAVGGLVLLEAAGVLSIRFVRDADGFYLSVERE